MVNQDQRNQRSERGWHHVLYIFSLMLAGESIYMLPYMRKTFQTSMEVVFGLSATEVGLLNSMFGILALACYFPGGWLADQFSARRLLTFSLVSTGLGGLYLNVFPDFAGLLGVHAFWGITSILTFWGALIKATRYWGSEGTQGISFGLLDGGRGLVAAVLASLATAVFAWGGTRPDGLRLVILVYSMMPVLAGLVVWLVVPDKMYAPRGGDESVSSKAGGGTAIGTPGVGFGRLRQLLARPRLWLLALVILASYLLFIGTYELPAFAERGFGQQAVFGAVLGTFRDWMRPIAAVAAGFLADRITARRVVGSAFVLLIAGFGSMFLMPTSESLIGLLWLQVALVAVAAFALRAVYFALLHEINIPLSLTGTAVGFVSVIGFTPDIFGHLLAGWFVDSAAGSLGYQHYFGFLSLVALGGLAATAVLRPRPMGRPVDQTEKPM